MQIFNSDLQYSHFYYQGGWTFLTGIVNFVNKIHCYTHELPGSESPLEERHWHEAIALLLLHWGGVQYWLRTLILA